MCVCVCVCVCVYVCVDGQLSNVLPVTVGVSQGSILDPLHFNLYLNDLLNVLKHCDNNMYADDTALSYASKSTTDLLMKTLYI